MIDRPLPSSPFSRFRSCAWALWSIADVGSSATRTDGVAARARATLARWRWPPESWRGFLPASSPVMPMLARSRSARSRAAAEEDLS